MSNEPYDDISTPWEALKPLIPYLPRQIFLPYVRSAVYWEMCPGEGKLVQGLQFFEYDVLTNYSADSLEWEPDVWDIAITNPPFSKKADFLRRCVELNKPFALLLPVTTLGVRRCQEWLDDVDVLFLPKRIDFTGKGRPWFATAWFTRWMLPDRMVFSKDV